MGGRPTEWAQESADLALESADSNPDPPKISVWVQALSLRKNSCQNFLEVKPAQQNGKGLVSGTKWSENSLSMLSLVFTQLNTAHM